MRRRDLNVLPFRFSPWFGQEGRAQSKPKPPPADEPLQAGQPPQGSLQDCLLPAPSAGELGREANAGTELRAVRVAHCSASDEEEEPLTLCEPENEADRPLQVRKLQQELTRRQQVEAEQQQKLDGLGRAHEKLESEVAATRRSMETAERNLEDIEFPMQPRIRKTKVEIAEIEEKIAELTKYMESLTKSYEHRKAEFMEELQEQEEQKEQVEKAIAQMEASLKKEEVPPGPECLSFVDGDLFSNIATLVILSNLLIMTIELIDGVEYKVLDMSFLVFYTVELTLKLIYKQRTFVCGPILIVAGNWLDLIIVLSGLFDVVFSLILGGAAKGGRFLAYLRFLRLARLARVLKVVHIFLKSDLSWAEGTIFQTFMMCVIAFNTALMGLEIHFDIPAWFFVEHTLLVIYTFELLVRLRLEGARFFCSQTSFAWNWLDFVIVVGAIIDMWVMPAIVLAMGSGAEDQTLSQVMTMLRMFRLFRILRLVRLVKSIPPLYTLVIGITQAMQGMSWVLVLTMGVLYICALLGCKLIGQGLALGSLDDGPDKQEVMDTFPGILEAVFNLFQAMNGDLGRVEPMLHFVPPSKCVMMMFMIVTNWAIFSILTAVVSDNMAKVTEEHDEEVQEEMAAQARAKCRERLTTIFNDLDANGTNTVDAGEFMELMNDVLIRDEVCQLSGLSPEDLRDLFELIATQKNGAEELTISREEFLRCVDKENRQVTLRSMMKLEKRLTSMENMLTGKLQLKSGRTYTPKI